MICKEDMTMRKLTALLLVLALTLCAACALADTNITVTGTGEVLVAADTAVVSVGVTVRKPDALFTYVRIIRRRDSRNRGKRRFRLRTGSRKDQCRCRKF